MDLINASFDYIIIMMAIRFVDNALDKDQQLSVRQKLTKFNLSNDFGFNKISLFTFLVTIANGRKLNLIEFFGKRFMPGTHGVVQADIARYILQDEQKFFSSNEYDTKINIALLDQNNWSGDVEDIRRCIISQFHLENSLSLASFNTALDDIDHSIKFLHKRIKDFANRNLSVISYWSKNNQAYRMYGKLYNNAGIYNTPEVDVLFIKMVEVENHELGPTI